MAFLTAGDPDHVLDPVDLTAVDVASIHPSLTREACLESMHLVHRDGRVEKGYDAVMTALSWTPLFWPFSLARHLPGSLPRWTPGLRSDCRESFPRHAVHRRRLRDQAARVAGAGPGLAPRPSPQTPTPAATGKARRR